MTTVWMDRGFICQISAEYFWQMLAFDAGISFLSDGPVSMPNMPNQMMSRMQVPQGKKTTFCNNIPI